VLLSAQDFVAFFQQFLRSLNGVYCFQKNALVNRSLFALHIYLIRNTTTNACIRSAIPTKPTDFARARGQNSTFD
jgi:hypothetical protein